MNRRDLAIQEHLALQPPGSVLAEQPSVLSQKGMPNEMVILKIQGPDATEEPKQHCLFVEKETP